MRKKLMSFVVRYLDRKGFEFKKNLNIGIVPLYNSMKKMFTPQNTDIVSVIFSKDRAMQLDAFLASYFEQVANYGVVKVLYHVSDERHNRSYEDLKLLYRNLPVEFIREKSFRNDLIKVLENTSCGRIMFYVDDMLFTTGVDYNWFKNIDPLKEILSLTRGKDLTHSTVLAKDLLVPQLTPASDQLLRFKWNEITEFSDWTYPIGVSGYMFSTTEMLAMIKSIDFKAPNSLEANLQVFLPYFSNRDGLCMEYIAAPCIHSNITQTEGYNHVLGHFSTDDLLALWNEKKRINYTAFFGLKGLEAQTKKYDFISRKEFE